MIPILSTVLVGMAAKLGIGAVAAAAKRIFGSSATSAGGSSSGGSSVSEATQPRRPFAEELDRAQAGQGVTGAASVSTSASPVALAAQPVAFRAPASAPPLKIEAPRLANDPTQMTLTRRTGRQRTNGWAHRLGRHQLGAYRRMTLGPR